MPNTARFVDQTAKSPDPLALLAAAGIEPTARAEEISVAGFAALARAFAERT